MDSGIRVFRGIPFAQPPIGDLRWKAPQPVAGWEGVRTADRFGPRAMQLPIIPSIRSDGMGEDCLYLNVWTPEKTGDERLPVLVCFYGGGLFVGDGSEPRYGGESMARRGTVSVTVNLCLARTRSALIPLTFPPTAHDTSSHDPDAPAAPLPSPDRRRGLRSDLALANLALRHYAGLGIAVGNSRFCAGRAVRVGQGRIAESAN